MRSSEDIIAKLEDVSVVENGSSDTNDLSPSSAVVKKKRKRNKNQYTVFGQAETALRLRTNQKVQIKKENAAEEQTKNELAIHIRAANRIAVLRHTPIDRIIPTLPYSKFVQTYNTFVEEYNNNNSSILNKLAKRRFKDDVETEPNQLTKDFPTFIAECKKLYGDDEDDAEINSDSGVEEIAQFKLEKLELTINETVKNIFKASDFDTFVSACEKHDVFVIRQGNGIVVRDSSGRVLYSSFMDHVENTNHRFTGNKTNPDFYVYASSKEPAKKSQKTTINEEVSLQASAQPVYQEGEMRINLLTREHKIPGGGFILIRLPASMS